MCILLLEQGSDGVDEGGEDMRSKGSSSWCGNDIPVGEYGVPGYGY